MQAIGRRFDPCILHHYKYSHMHSNQLTLRFAATECGGWPRVRVRLNGVQVAHLDFESAEQSITIDLGSEPGDHVLEVERWGKNSRNTSAQHDQVLELLQVQVDSVPVPESIIRDLSEFEWHERTDAGSFFFGPNGVWRMRFCTPILTYLLDHKIQHESKYTQDYLYPWSYRLGPGQAEKLLEDIEYVQARVEKLL